MAPKRPEDSRPPDEGPVPSPAHGTSSSPDEDRLRSPAWHADALREAEAALRAGRAQFVDWDNAKSRLRRIAAGLS